jgi:AraC-like DNA-binding protein
MGVQMSSRLDRILNNIPDESARKIVQLRLIARKENNRKFTWDEIAEEVGYSKREAQRIYNKTLEKALEGLR